MNQTQASRLVNVADALRDAHKAKWAFTMSTYGWRQRMGPVFLEEQGIPQDEVDWVIDHNCGTPACAIGHYAVRNDLQDKFKLTKFGKLTLAEPNIGEYEQEINHCDEDAQKWFGCDYFELSRLFDGGGCNGADTALQAAKFIEKFVEEKGFEIVKDGWV